jgi:hypothetical protein
MCPQAREITSLNRRKAVIYTLKNPRHYLHMPIGINSRRLTNVSLGFHVISEQE